jgi:hypothetical protein
MIALHALHVGGEEGEAMIDKRTARAVIQSIILVLVPVWGFAQKANYDFDKAKDFAHVRSFVLKTGERSDAPLVDRRVATAIVAQLSARGMSLVDRDADVFVVPRLTSETKKEVTAYNTGYWPYYAGWGYTGWDTRGGGIRRLGMGIRCGHDDL